MSYNTTAAKLLSSIFLHVRGAIGDAIWLIRAKRGKVVVDWPPLLILLMLISATQAWAELPVAPTNVQVAVRTNELYITWNDNSDEQRFFVYRNGQFYTTLPRDDHGLIDMSVVASTRYCYSVSAHSYLTGESAQSAPACATFGDPNSGTVPLPTPVPTPTHSYAIDYPVRTDKIYRYQDNIPSGSWYDYQPFGSMFNLSTKVHLGADINKLGGDQNLPVYSIADCAIDSLDNTDQANAWGKWIIISCSAPAGIHFRLSDGTSTDQIYVLYAHLSEIKVIKDDATELTASQMVKGTILKRGWQIGKVGNANGYYGTAYHLHFEIRAHGYNLIGNGYEDVNSLDFLKTRVDPLEFIENNRVAAQSLQKIFVHSYDLDVAGKSHMELDRNLWTRQQRNDVSRTDSLGYGNYLWLADSKVNTEASWYFYVPTSGYWEIYYYLPRSYATASVAKYELWHNDPSYANPRIFEINQYQSTGVNRRYYIGRFKFNSGWQYALVLHGSTLEVNPKKVAIDAIELNYNANQDLGGGYVSIVDQDLDFMDDLWENANGLDTSNAFDGLTDLDQDGINNLQEYNLGTDPQKADTDGDGFSDRDEYVAHYNPTDPLDCLTCANQGNTENTEEGGYNEPTTVDTSTDIVQPDIGNNVTVPTDLDDHQAEVTHVDDTAASQVTHVTSQAQPDVVNNVSMVSCSMNRGSGANGWFDLMIILLSICSLKLQRR